MHKRDYSRLDEINKMIGPLKPMRHTPKIMREMLYEAYRAKTGIYILQDQLKALKGELNAIKRVQGQ